MSTQAQLPARADVVVIGGGIAGTSTAYWLATETELSTVLIEKRAIASGSTGDSSAILRHHYGNRPVYSRMAWWSHEFYRSFEDRTGQPLAHRVAPRVAFGTIGTESGDYALDGYDVLRAEGIPVSRYDGDAIASEYPMLDVADCDVAISDDTAAFSDGADAANGFAATARAAGTTVATDTAVTAIETETSGGTDRVTAVSTDDGRIDCEHVVLTAGPWTSSLLSPLGIDIPLSVTREQVLLLEPTKAYLDRYPTILPTLSLPMEDWYARADFSDNVLVATHHTGGPVDPDDNQARSDEKAVLSLIDALIQVVPDLDDAGLAGEYAGLYTSTPDRDFVLDTTPIEGLVVGCGFSGHGFKHGPAIGRILADLVLENESDRFDLGDFSLKRFAAEDVTDPGDVHL